MEVSNVSLIVGLIVVLVSISWFFLKKYSKHSNVQVTLLTSLILFFILLFSSLFSQSIVSYSFFYSTLF